MNDFGSTIDIEEIIRLAYYFEAGSSYFQVWLPEGVEVGRKYPVSRGSIRAFGEWVLAYADEADESHRKSNSASQHEISRQVRARGY